MANTKQARKRARQAVARNQHLSAQRSQYRTPKGSDGDRLYGFQEGVAQERRCSS